MTVTPKNDVVEYTDTTGLKQKALGVVVFPYGGGASAELLPTGNSWTGGEGVVGVSGTWDGAASRLEFSFDEITWFPASGSELTADGSYGFRLPACFIRLATVNGGAGTDLTAVVK